MHGELGLFTVDWHAFAQLSNLTDYWRMYPGHSL